MNANKVYSKAVATLKPNKARMLAIHAAGSELHAKAKESVTALLCDGKSAKDLYRVACDSRNENESALDKEIRVILLGLVRKEG